MSFTVSQHVIGCLLLMPHLNSGSKPELTLTMKVDGTNKAWLDWFGFVNLKLIQQPWVCSTTIIVQAPGYASSPKQKQYYKKKKLIVDGTEPSILKNTLQSMHQPHYHNTFLL